jgi:alpha-N-acetylglucosaminidase
MRRLAFLLLILLVPLNARADALDGARGVLNRLIPKQADQFELALIPAPERGERWRVAKDGGHIRIEGSSPSAVLVGANWYLKYLAHVEISPNGDRVPAGRFPLPRRPIAGATPYSVRYALNENVDGYTTPYWDWPRWQREIDVLALSGINAVLVERGTDSVLYDTFREFGYGDEEIRAWITQPAHQNWQLMGNLCCFNGPISPDLLNKRAQSARRIASRLHELGITPVLPGFYGIVPADFDRKVAGTHVVPQGDWAGFTRPGWLDPRDPIFARLAESFYRHQRALFGDSTIYDMEVFQEGGDSADVPVPEAARQVQAALERAHPGARWMMLAWQGNPRQDLLSGVARDRLLVVDIDNGSLARDDRRTDFQDAPFLYGGLWEFGGRTTFGAALGTIAERLPRLGRSNANMIGSALFTEGIDTNPFAYDLFTELAWRAEPVDLDHWTEDFVRRRYGGDDRHALAAWQILRKTAYDLKVDEHPFNSERDAPAENLFDAQPSLSASMASNWSSPALRYDDALFRRALPELLAVTPALRASEPYRYDLVDVARQTLANEARRALPEIKAAYDAKDRQRFEALAGRWLQMMVLEDRLLATDRAFLVGSWLAPVRGWASSPDEALRLSYDARSILTTWGDRKASQDGPLHDYGNKDWAGLTADYYRLRWETYFRALDGELRSGRPAAPIDWFALGEAWNRGTQDYPDQPSGSAYEAAKRIAGFLTLDQLIDAEGRAPSRRARSP